MATLPPSDSNYELDENTLKRMAIFLLDHEARFFSKDMRVWKIEFASYGLDIPFVTEYRRTQLQKLCKDRGVTLFTRMEESGAAQVLNDTRGRGRGAKRKADGEIVQYKVWCQTWKDPGWDGSLTMPEGWTGGDIWNVTTPATLAMRRKVAPIITQAPRLSQRLTFQSDDKDSTQPSTQKPPTIEAGIPDLPSRSMFDHVEVPIHEEIKSGYQLAKGVSFQPRPKSTPSLQSRFTTSKSGGKFPTTKADYVSHLSSKEAGEEAAEKAGEEVCEAAAHEDRSVINAD